MKAHIPNGPSRSLLRIQKCLSPSISNSSSLLGFYPVEISAHHTDFASKRQIGLFEGRLIVAQWLCRFFLSVGMYTWFSTVLHNT